MQPNLKLVANTNLEPMHSGQNAAPNLAQKKVQPEARHLPLHALTVISADASLTPLRAKHKKPAYMLLAAVTGIHLAGIAWLLSAAATATALAMPKTELNTISVSLLSAPVAKPVIAVMPPKTKAVTKPVVKNKAVKTEVAKTEVANTEPLTTKDPVTSKNIVTTKVDASAVAASAVSADLATAEAAPETSIEPPSFAAAYLHNPAPEYPQLSRRMGEQGRVLLRVLVSSNGVADQVQIETSSGSSKLDTAALKAVEKWNFVPAKRSNQPVSAFVLVPVKFSLNS